MQGELSADIDAKSWERWITRALIVYFIARLSYFAITIRPNIPPDEITHVGVIQLYASAPVFIEDTPSSYQYGLVTRNPYLYYFLLGKLLKLNFLAANPYLILRICNIVLAALTIFISLRLAMLLTQNSLVRVLFILMLTNTPMLAFLFASVSYDNLANLLAALSLYSLFSFFQTKNSISLWCFLVFTLSGTLTKISFLPLGLILFLIYLYERRRLITSDFKNLLSSALSGGGRSIFLTTLAVALLGANFQLYGANLYYYGNLVPACDQVLTTDQCMENRIFARNRILMDYKTGKISFQNASMAADRIKHPGDRWDTQVLLKRVMLDKERIKKGRKPKPIDLFSYFHYWTNAIKAGTYGIHAHLHIKKLPSEMIPYNLLLLTAFLLWVRHVRLEERTRYLNYLAVVFGFYLLFLVGYVNLRQFLITRPISLGVQGRYMFPVIVPVYILISQYLLTPFRKKIQFALVVLVGAMFILGDFPYFYWHATQKWFTPL
jgi:hypothetical protein